MPKFQKVQMSANNISAAIFIRENTLLPAGLVLETEAFLPGWRAVQNLDGRGVANKIEDAKWNFFFLAGAIMCVAALASQALRSPVFVLLSVTFGGLLAGRLASLVLNGGLTGYGSTIRALYIVDAIGFALSVTAISVDREV